MLGYEMIVFDKIVVGMKVEIIVEMVFVMVEMVFVFVGMEEGMFK